MSKLTIKTPTSELRWWRLRLPTNEQGNVMHMTHNGVYDVESDPAKPVMITPPTQVVYEFFDGLDEQIEGVVACGTTQEHHRYYLLLLCDHRPTSNPDWVALDVVKLPLPIIERRYYEDVPLFQPDRTCE